MDNNILSVLVVDDELPIRESLKLINWEQHNTLLVGDVTNGKEALDFCRKYVPDIVISDITMPVMDGLELFRKLKEEFSTVKVIVLTCHSEFQYAKEALQIGALDYILKISLDDETLKAALYKAREAIEQEKLIQKTAKEIQRLNLSRIYAGLQSQFNHIDEGFIDGMRASGLEISFPCRQFCLYVETSSGNWIFVNSEIQNILEAEGRIKNWIPLSTGVFLIFINNVGLSASESEEYIQDMIDRFNNEIHKRLAFVSDDLRIFLSISPETNTSNAYIKLLRDMIQWKKAAFYYPEQTIFFGQPNLFKPLNNEIKDDFLMQVKRLSDDNKNLIEFIESQLRHWAVMHSVSPDELKDFMIDLLNSIQSDKNREISYVQKIWQTANINQMVHNVLHEMELKGISDKNYRIEIIKAITLIRKKYHEPISLSSIAEEVHLSSSYLSRLFSTEVGEAFNEFVTRVRMEAAETLLRSSNHKVFEIAEMVGIPNYRYFASIFRNWTGKSPKEYKMGG